jgi:hypothetical protein
VSDPTSQSIGRRIGYTNNVYYTVCGTAVEEGWTARLMGEVAVLLMLTVFCKIRAD